MSNYTTTVIKTGNSYALRVPKDYIKDSNLKLGQKAVIGPPIPNQKQNHQRIKDAVLKLQSVNAFKNIKDPVAWQKEIRQDRPLPGRK